MNNTTIGKTVSSSSPYIILVREFTAAYYSVSPAGTKAYSFPQSGSSVVYTFPQPTQNSRFAINSLVFCSDCYWVKIPNLGVNSKDGYVKCSDIGFDYTSYADPDNQTPNKEIGSNSDVIFNMWYFPIDSITGVNCPIPLYYRYYYIGVKKINSSKCTLLASISGEYKYEGTYYDPTTYLDDMTDKYWGSNGINAWIATMSISSSRSAIMQKAKSNLAAGKPLLVGASNGNLSHLVLVVGYKNSGNSLSDYIVLDSCLENFSDLQSFFTSYPQYANWNSVNGGFAYGEY